MSINDYQTKLFISSEVPIYQIFSDENEKGTGMSDHMRSVMDDLVSAASAGVTYCI